MLKRFRPRLAAVMLLIGSAASANVPLQPSAPPLGKAIPVDTTDFVNPVYLLIHFTAGELRGVDSIGIFDRTLKREVFRFSRAEFGPQIQNVPPDTPVTFGKNLTFRRPEKRSYHEIMISTFNERGHGIRVSTFAVNVEPHPSETLAADVSYQTFFDIAQIDFRDSCRPQTRSSGAMPGVFIGEQEQTFPSLAYLTGVQVRESLRGYFEGCVKAYQTCLGGRAGAQASQIQSFCSAQRDQLHHDVFGGK
jgi:hypothetical protein